MKVSSRPFRYNGTGSNCCLIPTIQIIFFYTESGEFNYFRERASISRRFFGSRKFFVFTILEFQLLDPAKAGRHFFPKKVAIQNKNEQ
jgi:hypothetical protein